MDLLYYDRSSTMMTLIYLVQIFRLVDPPIADGKMLVTVGGFKCERRDMILKSRESIAIEAYSRESVFSHQEPAPGIILPENSTYGYLFSMFTLPNILQEESHTKTSTTAFWISLGFFSNVVRVNLIWFRNDEVLLPTCHLKSGDLRLCIPGSYSMQTISKRDILRICIGDLEIGVLI